MHDISEVLDDDDRCLLAVSYTHLDVYKRQHISDVNPAIIFKFSKRAISFFCETIDDRFQHVDGIIPGSASATRRYWIN